MIACQRPLESEVLLDYWLGDTGEIDSERIEEHLLGCEACAESLRKLVELGEGVGRLAREGAVQVVLTPSFLAKAVRAGRRTREYRVAPGGRVQCTVTPEDDWVVAHLAADFTGVSRVDLVSTIDGQNEERLQDIPVGPGVRELILAPSMPFLRRLGTVELRMRLLAREGESERVLGEYTFAHMPTRP